MVAVVGDGTLSTVSQAALALGCAIRVVPQSSSATLHAWHDGTAVALFAVARSAAVRPGSE